MLLLASSCVAASPRLNPEQPYLIANAAVAGRSRRGFVGDFFEVASPPITSKYAEVVWKVLPSTPLPRLHDRSNAASRPPPLGHAASNQPHRSPAALVR